MCCDKWSPIFKTYGNKFRFRRWQNLLFECDNHIACATWPTERDRGDEGEGDMRERKRQKKCSEQDSLIFIWVSVCFYHFTNAISFGVCANECVCLWSASEHVYVCESVRVVRVCGTRVAVCDVHSCTRRYCGWMLYLRMWECGRECEQQHYDFYYSTYAIKIRFRLVDRSTLVCKFQKSITNSFSQRNR